MDYSIEPLDIGDKASMQSVTRLLSETFGYDVRDDKLASSTRTDSPHESLHLAAMQDGEVIGFNAFISHDLLFNGSAINAYQSCWTATSNAHRGKRIFQNLINSAKDILKSRDAAFIFGFPNPNSQPLFINKLGFKEIPSLKWQVPNIGIVRDLYTKSSATNISVFDKNSMLQNDGQLIELKSRQYGDEMVVVEHNDSQMWGVPRQTQKLGLNLRYFEIGGVNLNNPADIKPLFRSLCNQVKHVHYFQLTTTATNSYRELFNYLKPAQTEDLILFDLCFETTPDIRFNFFGGVKDVF